MAEEQPGVVDLRCPSNPSKLFAKLRLSGEQPSYIQPDNLIEMACWDCRKKLERSGRKARRVLHRYDLSGALISTLVEDEELSVSHGERSTQLCEVKETQWQSSVPCRAVTTT